MTRYKGRLSAKAIEKEFPYIVEMAVSKHGLMRVADEIGSGIGRVVSTANTVAAIPASQSGTCAGFFE
jgi:hypothetical protein